MVVLDTDHLSVLEWRANPEAECLRDRLKAVPPEEAAATVISFEEQTRGWLARLGSAKTVANQVEAYRRLLQALQNYCAIPMLSFDERAATEFQRLKKLKIRIGTMDLKIAAIALANDATLVSQNRRDFGKVPGLKVEDWTK
jgi:tRNA(fMet)-specific endonuclease VapC